MKTGVLLMAHGSPDSVDEMEDYLNHVMTRTHPTPEFIEEMKERYRSFGGRSPLLNITRAQAKALENRLGLPVKVGMRHWKPFIKEVTADWENRRVIGLVMAPHYSRVSVGAYRKVFEEAVPRERVFIDHWHDEPKLLDAWAEKIKTESPILFTAHSVPVASAEPYHAQIQETIKGILERIGPAQWDFAWQSRPNAPGEWMEPDVDFILKKKNWKSVFVVPIGFVCDHAEVLFDIDRLHRKTAEDLGMKYERAEMLNDSPLLIDALEAVVRRVL